MLTLPPGLPEGCQPLTSTLAVPMLVPDLWVNDRTYSRHIEDELVTASIRRRFGGAMLDGLFGIIIAIPVYAILGESSWDAADASPLSITIVIALGALLQFVFLMRYSATPGKLLLGIYVGNANGGRISLSQAIIRYLVFGVFYIDYLFPSGLISTAIFSIGIALFFISFAMALADPQHRALHDRLAGTRVLVGSPPPLRSRSEEALPRL